MLVACSGSNDAVEPPSGDVPVSETSETVAPPEEPTWIPLVSPHDWTITAADADPWWDFAPEGTVLCGDEGVHPFPLGTNVVLEIMTPMCPYLTVQQPLAEDVEAGDTLQLWIGHSTILDSIGVFVAELAVENGETTLWSLQHLVPDPEFGNYLQTFQAPTRLQKGTRLLFHLRLSDVPLVGHNRFTIYRHGDSIWWFLAFSKRDSAEAE